MSTELKANTLPNTPLPWFMPTWQRLLFCKDKKRVPSAILLYGARESGKLTFAKQFAELILCQGNSETQSCGNCRSCQLFKSGNHPDFSFIQPEDKSTTIKIEQIRHLVNVLNHTSMLNGYQVVIISPAEAMNKAAANALLKTLEEPQGKVIILLLAEKISFVPATIRSRCQCTRMPSPSKSQAATWLQAHLNPDEANIYLSLCDFIPVKALGFAQQKQLQSRDQLLLFLQQVQQLSQDPIKIAAECSDFSLTDLIHFLTTFVMDMIRIQFNASIEHLNNPDKFDELSQLSQGRTIEQLFKFLDTLLETAQLNSFHASINPQLVLEKIFINWCYNNDIS